MTEPQPNGFKAKMQVLTSLAQVGTIIFLIVGFFVTVRLEQDRLDTLEKIVEGTVSRSEVGEMLKTSNEIHQNLREQVTLLRAEDVYIRQDLAEMRREINALRGRQTP